MIDPTLPSSIAAVLREINRRLDNLERSPQIPFSSTRGGKFQFLDDTSRTTARLTIGNVPFTETVLTAGGSAGSTGDSEDVSGGYGVCQFDPDGAMIQGQLTGFRGMLLPNQAVPMHRPEIVNVTGSSFASIFESRINVCLGEVFHLYGAIQTDNGTTGELRVSSGTSHTDALTLPSNTNTFYRFEWTHPAVVGIGDDRAGRQSNLFPVFEARRTGGTGNVKVFPPQIAEITSLWLRPNANSTGNAVLF